MKINFDLLALIIMFLLLFGMYNVHVSEIKKCNDFYTDDTNNLRDFIKNDFVINTSKPINFSFLSSINDT